MRRVLRCGLVRGYACDMSDDTSQGNSAGPYDPDQDPDTEATMTAPEEGRPDGIGSGDAAAQHPSDEFLDAEEEESPTDE